MSTNLNDQGAQEKLGEAFRKALRRAGDQCDWSNPHKRSALAEKVGTTAEALAKFSYGCGAISVAQLAALCAELADDEFSAECAEYVN